MSSPNDQLQAMLAEMRAADAAVSSALEHAATTAYDLKRGRGDFLREAELAWDRLYETEEAKAAKNQALWKTLEELRAEQNTPEAIARREEGEAREAAEREAAIKARNYPVLLPAKQLGKVLQVGIDGTVSLGRLDESGSFFRETWPSVVRLHETCEMCPEQYDAYIGEQHMGYLRLRHGSFYAAYPDHGGDVVYEGLPNGDGCFSVEERPAYLDAARAALYERWLQDWGTATPEAIAKEAWRQGLERQREDEQNRAKWRKALGESEP